MNLFKKIFSGGAETPAITTEPNTIYAPVAGTAIPLSEIGDGIFSEGVLGPGCGIRPAAETIIAPFDGTIVQVADTKHAIGIAGSDGIELLIHVGIDTVSMNGKGFKVHVACGDKVSCGQKLLEFSRKDIANAGFSDVVAIIMTGSEQGGETQLVHSGEITNLEKLMTVSASA